MNWHAARMKKCMKVGMFSVHRFDQDAFEPISKDFKLDIDYYEARLSIETVKLAQDYEVICCFVNDDLNESVVEELAQGNVKLIALRCAGYNNVDVEKTKTLGMSVVRVPKYSPYSVAEHAVGLTLCLSRKLHRAYNRVREHNFSLDGLVGNELHNKTVGVVGTGKIGRAFTKIMSGFGCKVVAFDKKRNQEIQDLYGLKYVELNKLLKTSDIISLHLPLNSSTHHIIGPNEFKDMKKNSIIVNTGRGGLINSCALLNALESGEIGAAGLDVYEDEASYFFEDLSDSIIHDACLSRLLTFPNVIMTSHQAFLTHEALGNIARTTLESINDYRLGNKLKNLV